MKAFGFRPKLYTALKNYSKELFMADLMAGIIVGIVALPLAIAFGIASGSVYAYTHFAKFGQQFIRSVDDSGNDFTRNE